MTAPSGASIRSGGFWLLYTTAERTLALARYDASLAPERTLALQCGSDNTLYTQLLKLDGRFCLLSYDRLVRVDERAILQYTPIATVSALCGRSLRMQEYLGYQNGYTYAGVPNEGTCGSMMAVTVSLGVSKTCRDADGAAAFLTYCQSYDALRDIPADTARLRAAVNDQLSTGQEDAAEARYVISPEDAAQFYALLDEKPLLKNGNDTLCAILREEAAPYFAGVCNEQTAAANMQSRAQLYLMEQAG